MLFALTQLDWVLSANCSRTSVKLMLRCSLRSWNSSRSNHTSPSFMQQRPHPLHLKSTPPPHQTDGAAVDVAAIIRVARVGWWERAAGTTRQLVREAEHRKSSEQAGHMPLADGRHLDMGLCRGCRSLGRWSLVETSTRSRGQQREKDKTSGRPLSADYAVKSLLELRLLTDRLHNPLSAFTHSILGVVIIGNR